jgi:hypothetical protein
MKKTKEQSKYKPFLKGGGKPKHPYEDESERRKEITHRVVGTAFLLSVIALVLITLFGQYFFDR